MKSFQEHQSSSTEDLMVLLQAEIETIRYLNITKHQSKKKPQLNVMIDKYLNELDYNL